MLSDCLVTRRTIMIGARQTALMDAFTSFRTIIAVIKLVFPLFFAARTNDYGAMPDVDYMTVDHN